MSHSITIPPLHQSSPPPFDEFDDDQNESVSNPFRSDVLAADSQEIVSDTNNDDWKSADENQEIRSEKSLDEPVNFEEQSNGLESESQTLDEQERPAPNTSINHDFGWANFASFNETNEQSTEKLATKDSNDADDDWAQFESNPTPIVNEPDKSSSSIQNEQPAATENTTQVDDDDDEFGEFSEVQVSTEPKAPDPIPSSTNVSLTSEQIESLCSTCFPVDSFISENDNDSFQYTTLPSFSTTNKNIDTLSFLDPSIVLWKALAGLSDDPLGLKFQWRKSNAERLFHQSLHVSERYRAKTIPLNPEILQPEKVKIPPSTANSNESNDQRNQLTSQTTRPHFDWKKSGLENPLADNDSASLSSIISKDEDHVFDANKTLDLDFSLPPIKPPIESERQSTSSHNSTNENPANSQARVSIPIKTMDLYPGSTTTLSDEGKRIIESLPNLSFMSAKALMFPVRFNGTNQEESNSLF